MCAIKSPAPQTAIDNGCGFSQAGQTARLFLFANGGASDGKEN